MRLVVFALILSLIFGGFSSAAHAFGDSGCSSQVKVEKPIQDTCPDHQTDKDKTTDNTSDNASKICMDCAQCCGSHTLLNQGSYSISLKPQAAVLSPLIETHLASDFILSLLRPPKSLV